MEQLTFHEVIERITIKLTDSDDDIITSIYNQLFDNPIVYVGDDLWEEDIMEEDDIVDDDNDDDDDDDVSKRKNNKYDRFDSDDYYDINDYGDD
jgi:hypothetical protein